MTVSSESLDFMKVQRETSKYLESKLWERYNAKQAIEAAKEDPNTVIALCETRFEAIQQEDLYYQDKVKEFQPQEEEARVILGQLKSRLRDNKKESLELAGKINHNKELLRLLDLNEDNLLEEAKHNSGSALTILQYPLLKNKIPLSEYPNLAHSDARLVQIISKSLGEKEYSARSAEYFSNLKKSVSDEKLLKMITEIEDKAIRELLLKMKNYLQKKIENAAKQNERPWALGYLGSFFKVQKIQVPQGIFEIKLQLDYLDNPITPMAVLKNIESTLDKKLKDCNDVSYLAWFKRAVKYLFGCARRQETISEYKHLATFIAGS